VSRREFDLPVVHEMASVLVNLKPSMLISL